MRSLLTLTALLATAAIGCDGGGDRVRLERFDTRAELLSVSVEVAATAEERARGLRGHEPLAGGEGMLLELPHELEVCIVNDGVSFAIDAVYAADDGRVVAVERSIAAGDPTARCWDGTRRVLELSAGVAAGVAPGDWLIAD